MNTDEFWRIIERVHAASPDDMEKKCLLLGKELRKLSPDEVRSFEECFTDFYYQAYDENIWGAAYVINGGCSDDSFMDFRSTLISLGRAAFEAAVKDTDSLSNFHIDPEWATYQGYQSVATTVYEEMTGGLIPRSKAHPRKPTGVRFNEWEMSARFPKLVAKYGYKDSDSLWLKELAEKNARKKQVADLVAGIMLEAGIIPSCGLIPPLQVARNILRTGRSPQSTNRVFTWNPLELEEEYYWSTVIRLEKMSADEMKSREDLRDVKLRQDMEHRNVEDFDDWLRSLKNRGLL